MEIIELKEPVNAAADAKIWKIYMRFKLLLKELRTKNLPDATVEFINANIAMLNASPFSGKSLKKLLLKKQRQITKLLEREHKMVPHNYYRQLWSVWGMFVFGFPIGVALCTGVGNMGLLAVGLPIGLTIGIAVGTEMDNKAFKEGRQLNTKIKSGMC